MKTRHFKHRQIELSFRRRKFDLEIVRKGKKYNPFKKKPAPKLFGWRVIKAPPKLHIYDYKRTDVSYLQTMEFLRLIRLHFRRDPCKIDFTDTERASVAAMLVVYAAFDMAKGNGVAPATWISSTKSERVNTVVKRTNLLKLIQDDKFEYRFKGGDFLPIVSGASNLYIDDIVDHIQYQLYGNKMNDETEHAYGDAVSETINNVNRHAYPAEPLSENKRWWLMCEVFDKELYLAIYDSGVGMPKTVVEKTWFVSSLRKSSPKLYNELAAVQPGIEKQLIMPKIYDAMLIFLSMQGDITGTGEDKHGQGSKSIRKLVSECATGHLLIFSNSGVYSFRDEGTSPELHNLPQAFPGTLIQWNIKLP